MPLFSIRYLRTLHSLMHPLIVKHHKAPGEFLLGEFWRSQYKSGKFQHGEFLPGNSFVRYRPNNANDTSWILLSYLLMSFLYIVCLDDIFFLQTFKLTRFNVTTCRVTGQLVATNWRGELEIILQSFQMILLVLQHLHICNDSYSCEQFVFNELNQRYLCKCVSTSNIFLPEMRNKRVRFFLLGNKIPS